MKPEKLDQDEYDYLKNNHIQERGLKQIGMDAENYDTEKEDYLKK